MGSPLLFSSFCVLEEEVSVVLHISIEIQLLECCARQVLHIVLCCFLSVLFLIIGTLNGTSVVNLENIHSTIALDRM